MSKVPQATLNLAQRLYDLESKVADDSDHLFQGVDRVCEKLREPLQDLAGHSGYLSLLYRALTLAKKEKDILNYVQLRQSETIEFDWNAASHISEADRTHFKAAGVYFLGQLLGLLVAFIGDSLMMVLIRGIWHDDVLKQSIPSAEGK